MHWRESFNYLIDIMGQNAPEDNSEHADMMEYYGHLFNQSVAKGLKSLIYAIQFYISLI